MLYPLTAAVITADEASRCQTCNSGQNSAQAVALEQLSKCLHFAKHAVRMGKCTAKKKKTAYTKTHTHPVSVECHHRDTQLDPSGHLALWRS